MADISTETIARILDERDRYYLARIDSVDARMALIREAAETALNLARIESENTAKRISEALSDYKANTNEWQGTFREFRSSAVSRSENEIAMKAINDKIEGIERRLARRGGGDEVEGINRQQQNWRIGTIVVIAGSLLGLVYFIIGMIR